MIVTGATKKPAQYLGNTARARNRAPGWSTALATVLRSKVTGKPDRMAPENVVAHVVETSRRLSRQDGSPCAVHAVALYRIAYQQLWARYERESIPFMASDEEGGCS